MKTWIVEATDFAPWNPWQELASSRSEALEHAAEMHRLGYRVVITTPTGIPEVYDPEEG